MKQVWVLMIDVGPKSFKKQSDICHKCVRKLSIAKISQKQNATSSPNFTQPERSLLVQPCT